MKRKKPPLIFVIIPAKNEEKTISDIIRRVPSYCTVVVVDDGSTDDTPIKALEHGARLVRHPQSRGVGTAFKTGIDYCLANNADIIVNVDADGQMFPEDIKWLLYPIVREDADVVIANRFHFKYLPFKMPFLKRIGNKLFTRITSLATKQSFCDAQSGFRAYTRKAAAKISLSGGYTYTQESIIDLAHKNLKIVEVPLYIKAERVGKSRVVKSVWSYGVRALLLIIRMVRDNKPLNFFLFPGLALSVSSLIAGCALIIRWFFGNALFDYPWLNLAVVIVFVTGLLLIVFAMLADMLGRQKQLQEELLYNYKKRKGRLTC